MPTLHPELQTFFDSHKAATCDQKRACHDQLAPLMATCDQVIVHINDLQTKLTLAELAPHDHALDGKFEWMHTRLRAAMDRAQSFRTAGRDLARVMVEVEGSFNQDERDVALMLAGARDGLPQLLPVGESSQAVL